MAQDRGGHLNSPAMLARMDWNRCPWLPRVVLREIKRGYRYRPMSSTSVKVMIDIGHPAHVHYFRHVIDLLETGGHQVLVTSRDKDMALELLEKYGVPFRSRGRGGRSVLGKLWYIASADVWMLRSARAFQPDVMVGFSSPYPAHVSKMIGRPYVGITDTEHSVWQQRLFVPFSEYVLTPQCFKGSFGSKHVRFDSYMEMAYLSPRRFQPDPRVLSDLGLREGDAFTIVRFVDWAASHDRGHSGLTLGHKRQALEALREHGTVFVSSERRLPGDLVRYEFPLPADRMHHAMAFASLVYGESATMASEAAVLGTPAVYHDDIGRGYTDEQESRYGHVSRFSENSEGQQQGLQRALSVLRDTESKSAARTAAARIHREKIDTTDFVLQFILTVASNSSAHRGKTKVGL